MAKDDLTGNMATENLLDFCGEMQADLSIDRAEFGKSLEMADRVFPH